jgi:hypothetical protein
LQQIVPNAGRMQFRPQAEPQAEAQQGLWANAAGFRWLVAGAGGMSVAAAAVFLVASRPATQEPQNALPACNAKSDLWPLHATPMGGGAAVRFLSPQEAANLLQTTQARAGMAINPNYLANRRAVIRVNGGPAGRTVVALVPLGMDIRPGDQVDRQRGYVDSSLPCHYVPNLIAHKR